MDQWIEKASPSDVTLTNEDKFFNVFSPINFHNIADMRVLYVYRIQGCSSLEAALTDVWLISRMLCLISHQGVFLLDLFGSWDEKNIVLCNVEPQFWCGSPVRSAVCGFAYCFLSTLAWPVNWSWLGYFWASLSVPLPHCYICWS